MADSRKPYNPPRRQYPQQPLDPSLQQPFPQYNLSLPQLIDPAQLIGNSALGNPLTGQGFDQGTIQGGLPQLAPQNLTNQGPPATNVSQPAIGSQIPQQQSKWRELLTNPQMLNLFGLLASGLAGGGFAGQGYMQAQAMQRQSQLEEEQIRERRARLRLETAAEQRHQDTAQSEATERAARTQLLSAENIRNALDTAIKTGVTDATEIGQQLKLSQPEIDRTNEILAKSKRYVHSTTGEVTGTTPPPEQAGNYFAVPTVEEALKHSENIQRIQETKSKNKQLADEAAVRAQGVALQQVSLYRERGQAVPADLAKRAGLGEKDIPPEEIMYLYPRSMLPELRTVFRDAKGNIPERLPLTPSVAKIVEPIMTAYVHARYSPQQPREDLKIDPQTGAAYVRNKQGIWERAPAMDAPARDTAKRDIQTRIAAQQWAKNAGIDITQLTPQQAAYIEDTLASGGTPSIEPGGWPKQISNFLTGAGKNIVNVPATTAAITKPTVTATPKPAAAKAVTPVRIRVKLSDGRIGTIDEREFDAKTMTKLD